MKRLCNQISAGDRGETMAVDLVCGIMKCGSEGKKDLDLNWSVNTVNTVNMTTRTPVSTLSLLTIDLLF